MVAWAHMLLDMWKRSVVDEITYNVMICKLGSRWMSRPRVLPVEQALPTNSRICGSSTTRLQQGPPAEAAAFFHLHR